MKISRIHILIISCFFILSCYSKRFEGKIYQILKTDKGDKIEIINYNDKGQKDGKYLMVDTVGHILTKGKYKDGKQIGKWKFYNANGVVMQEFKFDRHGNEKSSMHVNQKW